MADNENVIEELENLEGKVLSIQSLLKAAKSKVLVNESISSNELELIVERIEKLDVVMRDRRDVGH